MWQIMVRDLKDRKWSLLAYLVATVGLLWLYVATFESSLASTQQLQELIKTYPKALLEIAGLNDLSIKTLESYLNMKHFSLLWPLVAIFLVLSRAGHHIAGEVQVRTMGLLLSLPMERWKVLAAKYCSGLVTIILFASFSVFTVMPLAALYNIEAHAGILFRLWLLLTMFMWSVYAMALAISSAVSEKGHVYALAGSALLVSYVAYIVGAVRDDWARLKDISIFYYFDTRSVLTGGAISGRSVGVFAGLILVGTVVSFWQFSRRDVAA